MLHHLAGATIQVANFVNYDCQFKKKNTHTNSQICDMNGFAYESWYRIYIELPILHFKGLTVKISIK